MATSNIPGQFVPLDIHYLRDPAVRRAGGNAELLFIRSLVYAKSADSDGFVPEFDLSTIAVGLQGVKRRVDALVREGLWIEVPGEGWHIRSWEKWNKTKAQIRAAKKVQREAAIKGNHERWHAGSGKRDPRCPHCYPDQVGDRDPDPAPDRVGLAEIEVEPEIEPEPEPDTSRKFADATDRPEITRLLDHLDKRIAQNGSRVLARTQRNIDATRLLLDKDGRTEDQIVQAIDWCQSDEFWRANIRSMSKLREQYDTLRLQAQRKARTAGGTSADRFRREMDRIQAEEPKAMQIEGGSL